jgi:hypothetical protein
MKRVESADPETGEECMSGKSHGPDLGHEEGQGGDEAEPVEPAG